MSVENNTIELRIQNNKERMLEQLKKTPIVEVACKKVGIGRTTYYRWRKEDKEFFADSEEAIQNGTGLINDMAESQLISAIRDGNMTGIIFWLRHRHPAFTNRLELTTKIIEDENLTDEQKKIVKQALKLGSLPSTDESYDQNN